MNWKDKMPKPVDYWVWGLMQERVYKTSVRDTSDLKQRLTDTWALGKRIKTLSTKLLINEKEVTCMQESKRINTLNIC